jgi:hypothetical protein
MDTRKPVERMNSYLRNLRPRDYQEFDRLVRLTLKWFDTHRIKDQQVFLDSEGKEYNAFIAYLTAELGVVPTFPSSDFLASMLTFSRETR